ncbi:LCP family protein [Candidatus Gracilibacteria bacterium]|nr:LCP family protein [Candidatus Gracilibacteria bacterium]
MSHFKTKKIQTKNTSDVFITDPKSSKLKNGFNKKKSPKIIRRIVSFLLIVALIVFGCVLGIRAIGNQQISKNNEYKIFNPIKALTKDDTQKKKETGPKGKKNILLTGIGGSGHAGSDLTDSIILASIDFDTKNVTLLSIPRDLYVAYSRYSAGRINGLYHIGKSKGQGINLLAEKIHEITGQNIDHYAVVDFQGFKQIINTLGGITVDVPKTILDKRYPTYDYRYTTFYLEKGRQTLDGETALRYARSRHSTSDIDRSARQQLILRSIKEKAMDLGLLTQPHKIADIFDSLQTHINTDLTIGEVGEMALAFKDIKKENIHLFNLNRHCIAMKCELGAYLYNPHRSYFGGAAAIIPEKAAPSRLSVYDDIVQFSKIIFSYPTLPKQPKWIRFQTTKTQKGNAYLVRKGFEQIGFPIDHKNALSYTGILAEKSHIKVFTGSDGSGNILDENSITVQALKALEPKMPIEFIPASTSTGVKIDIILGKDKKNYFTFAKPVNYYLNDISPKDDTTTSKTDDKKNNEKKSQKEDTKKPSSKNKKKPTLQKTSSKSSLSGEASQRKKLLGS